MSDPWRLSEREVQALTLLVKQGGPTNKEIGRAMGISHCTVHTHFETACRKLGASNRLHAALMWDRLLRSLERANNTLHAKLTLAMLQEREAA